MTQRGQSHGDPAHLWHTYCPSLPKSKRPLLALVSSGPCMGREGHWVSRLRQAQGDIPEECLPSSQEAGAKPREDGSKSPGREGLRSEHPATPPSPALPVHWEPLSRPSQQHPRTPVLEGRYAGQGQPACLTQNSELAADTGRLLSLLRSRCSQRTQTGVEGAQTCQVGACTVGSDHRGPPLGCVLLAGHTTSLFLGHLAWG